MAFHYEVYTKDKEIIRGTIEAATEDMAEKSLYGAGYTRVLSLQKIKPGMRWEQVLPTLLGVKRQEIIDFTDQLSTLVASGVPLLAGLQLLAAQARRKTLKNTLDDLVKQVQTGIPLSQAMGAHPLVFPETYLHVIQASEQAGNLDGGLQQAATYLARQQDTAHKIQKAMLYPVFVVIVAIGVVILLTTVALPPLIQLFTALGAELPWMTRALISITSFFLDNIAMVLAVLLAIVALIYSLLRSEAVKKAKDGYWLRIPVFGNLIIERSMQKFCQTSAMLLKAGLRLPQIMEIIIEGEKNRVLRQSLITVNRFLIEGEGLSEPMSRDPLFPPLLVEMIVVGEHSGDLDSVMNTLANVYTRKVEQRIDILISLIEPLLTVIIGIVVIFIALSMITPLYSVLGSVL